MIKHEEIREIVDYKLDSIEIEYDKSIKMIEKLESFLDKIDPSNERYCKNDRKELDYLKQNLQTLLSEKTKYNLILDYISQQEKKDELLELYRELVEKEEEYNTSDNTLQKMRLIEYLKGTRLEINALEEALK